MSGQFEYTYNLAYDVNVGSQDISNNDTMLALKNNFR